MLSQRAIVAGNLLVLTFLAALIGLGIRSLITKDMRFGWGMFGSSTLYEIAYAWELHDGTTVPATGSRWLKGKALNLLAPEEAHTTSYGLGAIAVWVKGYGKYVTERTENPSFAAFTATVLYSLNNTGEVDAEVYRFPMTE